MAGIAVATSGIVLPVSRGRLADLGLAPQHRRLLDLVGDRRRERVERDPGAFGRLHAHEARVGRAPRGHSERPLVEADRGASRTRTHD